MRKFGDDAGPSSMMKDMLADRDRRLAAKAKNPEPEPELPRDKVRRLAHEFHARARAREQAPKMIDATTGQKFTDLFPDNQEQQR